MNDLALFLLFRYIINLRLYCAFETRGEDTIPHYVPRTSSTIHLGLALAALSKKEIMDQSSKKYKSRLLGLGVSFLDVPNSKAV